MGYLNYLFACLSFFLILIPYSTSQVISAPVVQTENGRVSGRIGFSSSGNNYFAYRGIPYAQPPIGSLRFKAPVKANNWSGILEAVQDKSECLQHSNPPTGSEDCLYINVYSPIVNPDRNLSVMVWIYGGVFYEGNSSFNSFNPEYLLDDNVIFVSFNYRLGVFGFLSTEDSASYGNWGLKDQILALQWVQRNIQKFGGDPKKVTIFGESAGAVSVSYLLLTKKSTGLYRNAIMESGVSLCQWALSRKAREFAFQLGKKLGINTVNSSNLVDGLRKVDAKKLQDASMTASNLLLIEDPLAGLILAPVIEPDHEDAVVTTKADESFRSGNFNRVPIIVGINSNEASGADIGLIFRAYLLARYDLDSPLLAPVSLNANLINKTIAGFLIKFRYFGLFPISTENNSIVQFVDDDQFNRPVREAGLQQSKYAPVYFYVFSYIGATNYLTSSHGGVGHTGELPYIFKSNLPQGVSATPGGITTRNRMVRMWTNFAKFNNPTPISNDGLLQNKLWPQVNASSNNLAYLNISTNLLNETNPFEDRMKFYDFIFQKFGTPPYSTY